MQQTLFDNNLDELKTQETQTSEEGDVWVLGEHLIACGSATDEKIYSMIMGGQMADMILTDPPYGVSVAERNQSMNKKIGGNRNTVDIQGDSEGIDEALSLWKDTFRLAFSSLKAGGVVYCFSPQGGIQQMYLMESMNDNGITPRHQLIWVKNNHVLGRSDYSYQHEPIIYSWKPGAGHKFFGGFQTSLLFFDRPRSSKQHPTMKPVDLLTFLIKNSSEKGDVVLEPFSGSGSTLIACEVTGRRCRAIEIFPRYVDIAINRWEAITGKSAVHHDTGMTFSEMQEYRRAARTTSIPDSFS